MHRIDEHIAETIYLSKAAGGSPILWSRSTRLSGSGLPRNFGPLGCRPSSTPPVAMHPSQPLHGPEEPTAITIINNSIRSGAGFCTNPSNSIPLAEARRASCGGQYQATATMHGNHTVSLPARPSPRMKSKNKSAPIISHQDKETRDKTADAPAG
ncbi:hypothetical protein N657DRAFT_14867 [Parathielavia appendiculata]|uniref:Uncharacterized protein n=1 Tax=Parathielavia appendiculata TaxID=2587402 RepID=A0AAN6Z8B3_9PEZI|nr:hypothetical protein N657DRAFT_14867 [Parathielavia appendiculata]